MALLSALGDARLLEQFVRGVLTEQFDGSEAPALAEAARLLGPRRAAELLETIVRERMRAAPQGCVKLLGHVIEQPRESDAERKAWFATARKIAAACIDAVQTGKADSSLGKPHARATRGRRPSTPRRSPTSSIPSRYWRTRAFVPPLRRRSRQTARRSTSARRSCLPFRSGASAASR